MQITEIKEYLENHPTVAQSIIVFIFTAIMIGFSSHGLRNFLLNIVELIMVSSFITFILYAFAGFFEKTSKYNVPFIFLWASI